MLSTPVGKYHVGLGGLFGVANTPPANSAQAFGQQYAPVADAACSFCKKNEVLLTLGCAVAHLKALSFEIFWRSAHHFGWAAGRLGGWAAGRLGGWAAK